MKRSMAVVMLICFEIGSGQAPGQDPPATTPVPKVENVPKPGRIEFVGDSPIQKNFPKVEDIKPLPLVAIPDDPPPHEGAMIDLPITIEPPDMITIEVIEGLPGRPITGDHLVKPDGAVSLGFYGEVHVRGLTVEQAKIKVLMHLRKFVRDEALGLIADTGDAVDQPGGVAPPDAPNPFNLTPRPDVNEIEILRRPMPPPVPAPAATPKPAETLKSSGDADNSLSRNDRKAKRRQRVTLKIRRVKPTSRELPVATAPNQDPTPPGVQPPPDKGQVPPAVPEQDITRPEIHLVAPADSNRVFVDISAYHSKVYYVQGDVGVPGRLPWIGKETVLDALNYAGGLIPTAEPTDIHLYRPARGGKPARDYKIDHAAILRGEARANLQLFPDDRLVIGRNVIVKKTMEIDRALAPINSVWNAIFQSSLTARYVSSMSAPITGSNPDVKVNGRSVPNVANFDQMTIAQRDAFIKAYFEFVWSLSSKESGAMLDEAKFREEVMKRLNVPTPVAPDPK